ncbi:response regulator [Aphanothece sacrum]|uniref:Protein PatA n=1 Tax=Aphanothece sacrum FPU1 TaxID=1920663 RepID=A0A401IKM3_APHSA|nr:response regulator [Aphanothece sacrum]GBF81796.1 two-component response regulator [Aphanothece sacrum FPU1]GBF84328.1 two-component response regulator [Aphanothece sacrum FPU3]
MQGTLNEIDLRSILQLIELGQRTGELLVEAYGTSPLEYIQGDQTSGGNSVTPIASGSSGEFWLIFFVNGQIVYTVEGSSHQGSRLRDYLYRYRAEIPLNKLGNSTLETNNDLEYAYLWQLIESNLLTPDQGRNLIHSMVHETLFDVLSLSQGAFIFEMGMAFDPLLTNLEISPLVTQIMKEVRQWKQLHPHIQSSNQYLVITDGVKLQKALPEKAYEQLSGWAKKKTSLRQISRYLQRDLVPLAKGIYPYVERGWLHLGENSDDRPLGSTSTWEWTQTRQTPHIVCIDDDLTIGKKVESILTHNNYRSSIISDPLQALSQVFELKPDVILCDIAMPKLDGYEICTMLRHSSTFRHTPIIMLTGKEGFTDRIRARMVGSTDYLTKPFGEQELLLLLEKYGKP